MSLLEPQRRWRATKTDGWILGVGVGLVAGGFLVVLSTRNGPLWTFTADALLTGGVAIALVGIILRVQLDIQDELDDARRERLAFEQELRGEIAVIDERVRQAVEALRNEAPERHAANALRDRLVRELADARQQARDLEAQIKATEQSETGLGLLRAMRVTQKKGRAALRPPRLPRWVSPGGVIEILLALSLCTLMTLFLAGALAYLMQKLVPASADNLYGEVPISLIVSLPFAGLAWGAFIGWEFFADTRGNLPWRMRLGLGLVFAVIAQVFLVVVYA